MIARSLTTRRRRRVVARCGVVPPSLGSRPTFWSPESFTRLTDAVPSAPPGVWAVVRGTAAGAVPVAGTRACLARQITASSFIASGLSGPEAMILRRASRCQSGHDADQPRMEAKGEVGAAGVAAGIGCASERKSCGNDNRAFAAAGGCRPRHPRSRHLECTTSAAGGSLPGRERCGGVRDTRAARPRGGLHERIESASRLESGAGGAGVGGRVRWNAVRRVLICRP